jgi:hypothetical protein
LSARLIVDLSDVGATAWVRIAVAAVLRARLAQLQRGEVPVGFIVVVEAWSLVGDEVGRDLLVRALKLARAFGVAVIVVTHRIDDLASALDITSDVGTIVAFAHRPARPPSSCKRCDSTSGSVTSWRAWSVGWRSGCGVLTAVWFATWCARASVGSSIPTSACEQERA